mgnify:CR=1 FL=1
MNNFDISNFRGLNKTDINKTVRLLDRLNCKYKMCKSVKCGHLFTSNNKTQKYCKTESCISERKEAEKIRNDVRLKSKQIYPTQKCSVINCNKIGTRHHEDYAKTDCLFLCHKHHRKLHNLSFQVTGIPLSESIMFKFLNNEKI